jgi:hypothetical protein
MFWRDNASAPCTNKGAQANPTRPRRTPRLFVEDIKRGTMLA